MKAIRKTESRGIERNSNSGKHIKRNVLLDHQDCKVTSNCRVDNERTLMQLRRLWKTLLNKNERSRFEERRLCRTKIVKFLEGHLNNPCELVRLLALDLLCGAVPRLEDKTDTLLQPLMAMVIHGIGENSTKDVKMKALHFLRAYSRNTDDMCRFLENFSRYGLENNSEEIKVYCLLGTSVIFDRDIGDRLYTLLVPPVANLLKEDATPSVFLSSYRTLKRVHERIQDERFFNLLQQAQPGSQTVYVTFLNFEDHDPYLNSDTQHLSALISEYEKKREKIHLPKAFGVVDASNLIRIGVTRDCERSVMVSNMQMTFKRASWNEADLECHILDLIKLIACFVYDSNRPIQMSGLKIMKQMVSRMGLYLAPHVVNLVEILLETIISPNNKVRSKAEKVLYLLMGKVHPMTVIWELLENCEDRHKETVIRFILERIKSFSYCELDLVDLCLTVGREMENVNSVIRGASHDCVTLLLNIMDSSPVSTLREKTIRLLSRDLKPETFHVLRVANGGSSPYQNNFEFGSGENTINSLISTAHTDETFSTVTHSSTSHLSSEINNRFIGSINSCSTLRSAIICNTPSESGESTMRETTIDNRFRPSRIWSHREYISHVSNRPTSPESFFSCSMKDKTGISRCTSNVTLDKPTLGEPVCSSTPRKPWTPPEKLSMARSISTGLPSDASVVTDCLAGGDITCESKVSSSLTPVGQRKATPHVFEQEISCGTSDGGGDWFEGSSDVETLQYFEDDDIRSSTESNDCNEISALEGVRNSEKIDCTLGCRVKLLSPESHNFNILQVSNPTPLNRIKELNEYEDDEKGGNLIEIFPTSITSPAASMNEFRKDSSQVSNGRKKFTVHSLETLNNSDSLNPSPDETLYCDKVSVVSEQERRRNADETQLSNSSKYSSKKFKKSKSSICITDPICSKTLPIKSSKSLTHDQNGTEISFDDCLSSTSTILSLSKQEIPEKDTAPTAGSAMDFAEEKVKVLKRTRISKESVQSKHSSEKFKRYLKVCFDVPIVTAESEGSCIADNHENVTNTENLPKTCSQDSALSSHNVLIQQHDDVDAVSLEMKSGTRRKSNNITQPKKSSEMSKTTEKSRIPLNKRCTKSLTVYSSAKSVKDNLGISMLPESFACSKRISVKQHIKAQDTNTLESNRSSFEEVLAKPKTSFSESRSRKVTFNYKDGKQSRHKQQHNDSITTSNEIIANKVKETVKLQEPATNFLIHKQNNKMENEAKHTNQEKNSKIAKKASPLTPKITKQIKSSFSCPKLNKVVPPNKTAKKKLSYDYGTSRVAIDASNLDPEAPRVHIPIISYQDSTMNLNTEPPITCQSEDSGTDNNVQIVYTPKQKGNSTVASNIYGRISRKDKAISISTSCAGTSQKTLTKDHYVSSTESDGNLEVPEDILVYSEEEVSSTPTNGDENMVEGSIADNEYRNSLPEAEEDQTLRETSDGNQDLEEDPHNYSSVSTDISDADVDKAGDRIVESDNEPTGMASSLTSTDDVQEIPPCQKGREIPRTPVLAAEKKTGSEVRKDGSSRLKEAKMKQSIQDKTEKKIRKVAFQKKIEVVSNSSQKRMIKRVEDEEEQEEQMMPETEMEEDTEISDRSEKCFVACQWRRDLEYSAKAGTCEWAVRFESTVEKMRPFPSQDVAELEMKKAVEDLYGSAWKLKEEAMWMAIRLAKHHPELLNDNISKIILATCNEVKNYRQSVAGKAILTIGYLFDIMGKKLENKLRLVFKALLAKSGNRTLAAYYRLVIKSLFKIVNSTSGQKAALALIHEGSRHHNKVSRQTAAQFLALLTESLGPSNSLAGSLAPHMINCAAKFVFDSIALTRYCGKKMFQVFIRNPNFEKLKNHHLDINTTQNLTRLLEQIVSKGVHEEMLPISIILKKEKN